MTTTQDPIAHAARLLREAAEELRQAHTYPRSEDWGRETDAKAAYDEHMAAAQALEDWEAAVGAGGVQALSAVPAGWKLVPVEPTNDMQKAADEWAAKGFDWPKAVYRAMLAASPTPPAEQPQPRYSHLHDADVVHGKRLSVYSKPPAEQQDAPKAAPGDEGKALAALRYYMHECSGAEPSISVFHRMVEEALGAAPQQKPSQDTMYLLRRLLSNQHTLTGPEFRAELEKIVGEAYQQEAQEPVSPRHPVVVQWRDNAIEACAKIADAYGHEHAAQDMRAMLTAPQPAPASLSEQDERRAFEQDFMRVLPGENLKRKFGHYEDPRTRHRWDGWKARAALATQGGE